MSDMIEKHAIAEKHTVIESHETEKSEAVHLYENWVTTVIPNLLVPRIAELEKNFDAVRHDDSPMASDIRKETRTKLGDLVDVMEEVLQDPNVPQEIRDKYEAHLEPIRKRIERLHQRVEPQEYDLNMLTVAQDLLQIREMLKERGGDPKVAETMRQEIERLGQELQRMDAEADYPDTEVRRDVESIYRELQQDWVSSAPPSVPNERPLSSAQADATWMPRVPRPPYAVRLATSVSDMAPPARDVSVEGWDINALEQVLETFRAEHNRILAEHEAMVESLNTQIRDRKLQTLRDTLKPSK